LRTGDLGAGVTLGGGRLEHESSGNGRRQRLIWGNLGVLVGDDHERDVNCFRRLLG